MVFRSLFDRPRIAIVEMFGGIGGAVKTPEYARLLSRLMESDGVRAVILDIDSPGGSATASEYLFRMTKKLAAKKPVIAFIRGTGASGAYMIGCGATRIVALPNAIVGSIGVISYRPLVSELLERLGLRVNVLKSGRLKDMWSPFREPTEEERRKEQALLDEIYESFLEAVGQGRNLDMARVRELATGELFTARTAKDLGLVDELGDLDTAVQLAMQLGDAPRRLAYMRTPRSLRDRLMGRFVSIVFESIVTETDRVLWQRRFQYSAKPQRKVR
jgi:protease-4